MSKIVVIGATGYTGRLVVAALARRGHRPIIAGRNERSITALSEEHGGLEYRLADAGDTDSLRALVEKGEVLVSTVGPFEKYGHPVAAAAVSVGAHYIDSTGEIGFVRELQRKHDDGASRAGSTLLPAFGYDFVPGTLAGALAVTASNHEARTLRIGYFATGSVRNGLSQGTRATLMDGILRPVSVYRNGSLHEERAAHLVHRFRVRDRRRDGFLAAGTESLFLPADFPELQAVEVYNGWFPNLARLAQAGSGIASAAARLPGGRRAIERLGMALAGPPGGPDASERSKTLTHATAEAFDARGELIASAHLEGPSIYSLTGELIAAGALRLAEGSVEHYGVLGPLQAFDSRGLEELCRSVGLVEIDM